MRFRNCVGKSLILALFCISASACDRFPFGRHADTSNLQSTASDPQVRAFYEARKWKAAWDKKSENALLGIIAQAPCNVANPLLCEQLRGQPSRFNGPALEPQQEIKMPSLWRSRTEAKRRAPSWRR